MKIAFLVSTLKASGPINIVYNIVKYLDRSEFKPIVITLSTAKYNSKEKEFEKLGCEVLNLGLSRVAGIFKTKSLLNKVVVEKKIDIIHTHGLRADGVLRKVKNVKKISTLHNFPRDDYVMKFGKIKGCFMAYLHLKSIRKNENNISCSKSLSKIFKFKEGLDFEYIQNGVDQENFKKNDMISKKDMRIKLGLPLESNLYLSVGSLIPRKNPFELIEAFKDDTLINEKIIFLGEGKLMGECKELSSDNMIFKGNVDNVKDYLIASDFFLSSSLSEGLPNTVLEALALEVPCVLSDIEAHKEILELNNQAGRLFSIGNKENLITEIQTLKNGNYQLKSSAARSIIDKVLNAKEMSLNYQKVYKKIVGEN